MTESYDEAVQWIKEAMSEQKSLSVGIVSDAGDLLEKLLADNLIPDILTDQTSAHDPLNGYVPHDLNLREAEQLRKQDPKSYQEKSIQSMARHVDRSEEHTSELQSRENL